MLALTNKFGDEPNWLKYSDYLKLRQLHNLAYKKENKFISDESHVRGIPTKEKLEDYYENLRTYFK